MTHHFCKKGLSNACIGPLKIWLPAFFAFLFLGKSLPAQALLQLHLQPTEQDVFFQNIKKFNPQPTEVQGATATFLLPDSAALAPLVRRLLQFFQEKSFLTASLDSLRQNSLGQASARLHLGPPMRWVSLRPATADARAWAAAANVKEKLFTGKPLSPDRVRRAEQRILTAAEDHGHPFAAVWLDSIDVREDGGVAALLQVEPGRFFTFKELKIKGDLRLPRAFLPNYLGLKPGAPYSRAQVLRIREQLRDLLFLEATGEPTVTFAGSEATVNLFLRKKRAGRFDFIIGLLPQPEAATKRVLLTGSLSAAFQNALNLGERFSLELERLRPETQRLEVEATLPYVLGSTFGADGRLHIFRRDSTWVDAQSELGVQYLLSGANYMRAFWENKSSSLQKVDTPAILQTRRLPTNLDLRQNGFGLEANLSHLDYRFNPRRGWALNLRGVAGFNAVLRNPTIEGLRDPENPALRLGSALYDSLPEGQRAARFRLEMQGEYFIPLWLRTALKVGWQGGGIFSARPVFANEQYRLGGSKRLRGFDEESLFATRYGVATLELRLLLSQNSYLSAFTDYGYLENLTNQVRAFQRPWGVGAGMNFETKAGIFGISLAAGRRDVGEGIDLRATKFHLGYVSLF